MISPMVRPMITSMINPDSAETQGPELVINGDFATDSDWIKGVGWSIAGGEAVSDGSQAGFESIAQSITVVNGETYTISADFNITSGGVRLLADNTTIVSTLRTVSGFYEQTFTANATSSDIGGRCNSAFTGSIDNVSVRRVL